MRLFRVKLFPVNRAEFGLFNVKLKSFTYFYPEEKSPLTISFL